MSRPPNRAVIKKQVFFINDIVAMVLRFWHLNETRDVNNGPSKIGNAFLAVHHGVCWLKHNSGR